MTKIELVKQSVQMYIDARTKEVEELQKEIKESASRYSAYDMVTFLPGKIRDLEKAMNELRMYNEQLKALNFIESEN